MAKSKNINLNLTPEIEIAQTLFDEWRQSIDGYNGTNPVNPSNFEILDSEIGRINAILETVSTLKFEKVNELPDKSQAKENIIYLVPASNTGEKNYYEEYIFLKNDNKYELIGSTQITFDNEPTEGSQNGVTSGGVYTALQDKVDKEQGKGLSSNDYTNDEKSKLAGIETGAQVNVQADWEENDPNSDSYIANKPTVPASQVNSDWNAQSGVAQILNKPDLSDVAFSGSYNDLLDTPDIPQSQIQSDWEQEDTTAKDYIKNKPTIPTATSDLTNDSGFISGITSSDVTTALGYTPGTSNFSGSYNDLEDKPEIPLEQIQSDWNQTNTTAKDYIKNKPTIIDPQIAPEFELFKRYVNYLASLHNVELGENTVVEYDDGTQEAIQISYIDYGRAVVETDSGIEQIIVEDDSSSSDAMTESEVNDSFIIEV